MDGGVDLRWNPNSDFRYQCRLVSSPTIQRRLNSRAFSGSALSFSVSYLPGKERRVYRKWFSMFSVSLKLSLYWLQLWTVGLHIESHFTSFVHENVLSQDLSSGLINLCNTYSRKKLPLIASNLHVSYPRLMSFHVLKQEEANCCADMLWLRILWPQGSLWFAECLYTQCLDSFLHFSLGLFLWTQFSSMHLIIEKFEFVFD